MERPCLKINNKNSFKSKLYLDKCRFVIVPAMLIDTLADYCIQVFQLDYIILLTFFNNSPQKILKENKDLDVPD